MDNNFYNGHDGLYHHAKFGEDPTTRAGCGCENVVFVFCLFFIRLDALALSVIDTATWLGGWVPGWVAGWLSHSGTVSKRLNLSENFFDRLKAPSF